MREFSNLFAEHRKLNLKEKRAVLATVVQVRGSSYRSPGARMLITEEGRWFGSISGGCLEGDALRKARTVMQSQQPMTVVYDTNEGSDQNLGINLGCNGIIDVLLEPITEKNDPLLLFEQHAELGQSYAVASVYRSPNDRYTGERLAVTSNGAKSAGFSDPRIDDLVWMDLVETFDSRRSHTRTFPFDDGVLEVFIELIQPRIALMVFGGGIDARPVTALAKTLGWNVGVTDECVAHIAPVFFPQADQLSLCHREFIDREFSITPSTACVLMSHNYEYDRDVLKKLLLTPAPYIGILGPKKRLDRMQKELESLGIFLSDSDLNRIHAPIGLDIAAESAEEIAVSIVAEIQAKFHHRQGHFLKNRTTTIHDRSIETDQVLKIGYL